MKKQTSLLLTSVLALGMTFGVADLSPKASSVTTVKINKGDTLWGVSQQYEGVSVSDLLTTNPHLDPYALPIGQELTIVHPNNHFGQEQELVTYAVQPGDTLYSIAERYEGVTVQGLLHLNEGIDPYHLPVGMVLFLAIPDEPTMVFHTIQPGNTFWQIASVYDGVTVEDLRAANPHVNENELTIGSQIIIPLD
ncbi:LysM peptidoglycan-binding domain-containing protein [Anaerobacillus alkaliphilus]|uniref:LysM peptidoglycan-binding domain-containing protein n=1 Tax=Anaerobacillus alkaliphilus TaxID=1548597 RepID=A0A4Q0VYZ1_9BACI|nr:LysM domain-containing protein [Anaerobacillus alkaliphilus]RXJ04288.1 LysM peptidoglycan-binding domain-containing protein [Anaerobacillus alkaliphilus]